MRKTTIMNEELFRLDEVDPEDLGDVLNMLDKSFNLSLPTDSFKHAKTFGDICDVFETNIVGQHIDDCTSQQAFYKIRAAIAASQSVDKSYIEADSRVEHLFPRKNRKNDVRRFKQRLGIPLDFLGIKTWQAWVLFLGILFSLIAFFFSWRIALTGLTFFALAGWIAGKLGKELQVKTVGDLSKLLLTTNYRQARRHPDTINKHEIRRIIKQAFMERLDVDEDSLTNDARIG